MKTLESVDNKVQVNETANAQESNIYYVVKYQINHFDENRKGSTVVDEKVIIREKTAIKAREMAFKKAFSISLSAREDGKLIDGHLDSPFEGMIKQMRNINVLFIEVDCVNDITGEEITINEADFDNQPEDDCLENSINEYLWYKEMGYSTKGLTKTVEHEGTKT